MKRLIAAKVPRPGHLLGWSLRVLFAASLIIGCAGKRDEGVEVVVLVDSNGTAVPDVVNDPYPDRYITPSEIKIGLKSVKLIKSGETSPSYTIFDTADNTKPIVLDLTTTAQRADINGAFPTGCECEFSKAQIELTYFDIQVPFYENSNTATDHRVRFYTLDITDPDIGTPVQAGDVLIGNTTATPAFNWVDTFNGSFVPLTGIRPIAPLKVPTALFPNPNQTYSPAVTIDFDPFFKIPDKPKGIFTVTLTVHIGNMFFYDETDAGAPDNARFDRFTDGQLNANEPDSHYYPTFPTISATGP